MIKYASPSATCLYFDISKSTLDSYVDKGILIENKQFKILAGGDRRYILSEVEKVIFLTPQKINIEKEVLELLDR